jgi:uncharacterized protein (TIGR02996 family)
MDYNLASGIPLLHDPTIGAVKCIVWGSGEGAVEAAVIPTTFEAALGFVWHRQPDELAFWAAMLAAPTDPLPRQIYADWLDEHGDPTAGTLREARPFLLHYLVDEGGRWEVQNGRRAGWALAAAELRALAARGAVALPQAVRDFNCLGLSCTVRPRVSARRPRRAGWDQHRLEIRLTSGEPAPPFVNYLLHRTAGLGISGVGSGR